MGTEGEMGEIGDRVVRWVRYGNRVVRYGG